MFYELCEIASIELVNFEIARLVAKYILTEELRFVIIVTIVNKTYWIGKKRTKIKKHDASNNIPKLVKLFRLESHTRITISQKFGSYKTIILMF